MGKKEILDILIPLTIILLAGLIILVIVAIDRIPKLRKSATRKLQRHIECDPKSAPIASHLLTRWEHVNFRLVLDDLQREAGIEPIYCPNSPFSYLFHNANYSTQGPQWQRVPVGLREYRQLPMNAIYRLKHQGKPFVAQLVSEQSVGYDEGFEQVRVIDYRFEVMAADEAVAKEAVEQIVDLAQRQSIYKGQTLALVSGSHFGERFSIDFRDVPVVARGDIILPEELLRMVERNVLGFLNHAEALKKAGRDLRRGILLHGPPGVGKTLLVRYLTKACAGHTVILLTGQNLTLLRESMQLARMLAPSIVVLEDVDLIAGERSSNPLMTMLHELLDELDGVGKRTECIVLMTTNRPEMLEPALASRPGRVDQAIMIEMPDAGCRERLIRLFSADLELGPIDMPQWVERTQGTSPAFISEWLRKAALFSAERDGKGDRLLITNDDLEASMRELVVFGGKMTQQILGFRNSVS